MQHLATWSKSWKVLWRSVLAGLRKTQQLLSILSDKSKMKDDGGIQDITTKYFCWNAFYSLFFLVLWLGRVKRLHKQENKPVCLHNVKVFRSTRTKNCQTTGTGIGDRDPRRWQYNLMGHHPPITLKECSDNKVPTTKSSIQLYILPKNQICFVYTTALSYSEHSSSDWLNCMGIYA